MVVRFGGMGALVALGLGSVLVSFRVLSVSLSCLRGARRARRARGLALFPSPQGSWL